MLDSLWTRVLAALEGRIPETAIESWLRPCRVTAMDGDVIRIAAPNKYSRDWLVQHYTETILSAARTVLGGNPVVSIEIDREPERAPAPARELPAVPLSNGLSPRYTFESFVIGNSNQFAQAASQAVAELPSKAYNPLFIYGGVGLGKTHLLHAVGHEIARLYPSLRLLYLSTERFTNDLINAIRYDRTAEFRAKYRTIDLLLIDDIQFISGKERTQEEFFHTFNDLYEARKQIVVSSDSAPKEIPEIEERLRSRFEWGLIADIQPPDFETRVAILKKKAEIESGSPTTSPISSRAASRPISARSRAR
jgi:chromosomal replication initiator protein